MPKNEQKSSWEETLALSGFTKGGPVSLVRVLACPKGYAFSCGVGCTYTAEQRTFDRLRQDLQVDISKTRMEAFEKGESFRLYVQQGKNSLVHNAVKAVKPENGVLHAKVYAIKYANLKDEESCRYRVVVSSANLTDSEELNVSAVFESVFESELESADCAFGKSVSTFFKRNGFGEHPDWLNNLLNELGQANFKTSAEFLAMPPTVCEQMREDAAKSQAATIFSPFLTEDIVQEFGKIEACNLVSRPDQMDACAETLKAGKINCYTIGGQEELPEEPPEETTKGKKDDPLALPDILHAKLYRFYIGNKTVTYLGSANATYSAFHNNIEALVRIESGPAKPEELKAPYYMEYEPRAAEKIQEQKDFETACRKIINSFAYDESAYYVDVVGKYPVQINQEEGKLAQERYQWERKKKQTHCVTLKIKAEDFHLLVEGTPLEPDPIELKQAVQNAIIDRILGRRVGRSGGSDGSDAQAKGGGKQTHGGTPPRQPGLTETLSGLRSADEIQKVYERAKDLLEKLPNSDPNYKVLKAFTTDCGNLPFMNLKREGKSHGNG